MKSPFKFLDSFELKDRAVFFGFDKEISALYQLAHQSNLLLVYGFSGTGKTSLIKCGLASQFDGPQWFPFHIRRGENINLSLRQELEQVMDATLEPRLPLETLVEEIYDEYLSPIYLIFDQFEELFILGDQTEQQQFAQDIQLLLTQDLPCKVIFIIREEFLGELYELEQYLPHLFDFKFRVEVMNYLRIHQILKSSFDTFKITLESPSEDRIEEMIGNLKGKQKTIQLTYLQVYMDMLWSDAYEQQKDDVAVTAKELPKLTFTQQQIEMLGNIDGVLQRFLLAKEKEIYQYLDQQYPEANLKEDIVRRILDKFVTKEGTKQPVYFEQGGQQLVLKLISDPEIAPQILQTCILLLEEDRILRRRDQSFELAHDSLAKLIDDNRSKEEKRFNLIRQEIETLHKTDHFLNAKFLREYEDDLSKMELKPELADFVEKSKLAEVKKQEEQRRIQEERKRQRELDIKLEIERKTSRRRRNLSILAGLLGLMAFSFMVYAFNLNTDLTSTNFQYQIKSAESYALNLEFGAAVKTLEDLKVNTAKNLNTIQKKRLNELLHDYQEINEWILEADSLSARNWEESDKLGWDKALKLIGKAAAKAPDNINLKTLYEKQARKNAIEAETAYQFVVDYCLEGIHDSVVIDDRWKVAKTLAPEKAEYQQLPKDCKFKARKE
ncbi:nSTAND1 domain-containing NTPase [Flavilitoribacter nigricans]|uniref:Novel STAND NTPase 1 domain-containing protein n=1 Tax=Flavilitoribacter nigricans (strain ATCC 23147 / DSM 23189 / NBRC 102662 / NCIMB 1420 / SS-2) TaxID=1122177 RepID=A0A2D0N0F8_FLAN2|nr:hypothetical protein [Flavilitoribacter nigricans]PHN02011.1 hypothetical protein CRP01_34460 [Flavilitoribacter nigricans DSM 23189 = NBRC 102662]